MLKNTPDTIFLQIGEACPEDADFKDCHGVTWCADKQHDNDITYVRADQVPSVQKPVGHVVTMEALVPGGATKYHAQIYEPLPAGANLYAAAPLAPPGTLQITGAAQMRLTESVLAGAIEDAAIRYANGHPTDFQAVARAIITRAMAETREMAAMPHPQDQEGAPERGTLTWLIGMLRYLASTAVSGKQKVYINDPTFGRVEVGGALYGTGDVELTPNDDDEEAGAAQHAAAFATPTVASPAAGMRVYDVFIGGGGLNPDGTDAYGVPSPRSGEAPHNG